MLNKDSVLPKEKTEPKPSLRDYPILVYGRERVGKTTLCAQFEDPLFLFFEPGGKSLSLYAKSIKNWKQFKEILKALDDSDEYKTVVIDTVDKAHDMAMEYICQKQGVEHPSDAKWGKAWNALDNEFEKAMFRILKSGRGLLLTSHSEEKDITNFKGEVLNMTAPTAGKQVIRFVRRYVDLILYYYYGKNDSRWIRVQGNSDIVAGSRIDGHFKGITKFNAGLDAEAAYENLVKAFNNELTEESTDAKERSGISSGKGIQKVLRLKRG